MTAQTFTYSGVSVTGGVHILTDSEAAVVLRCEVTDSNMLQLLPLVDSYIEMATGRDWTIDTTIYPEAKSAARMLLVRWHEDPGGMAAGVTLSHGLMATLTQLEAKAMELAMSGTPDELMEEDEALEIEETNIHGEMDITASFVLIFNHKMAAGSTSAVTLKTAAGATVTTVNSLDATAKIMTINPSASLSAASAYYLDIVDAADVYGQTIETTIAITTA